ncbi:hypothetical protein G647_04310 [Cladophialophora carrionii CBS 160.54]|uniref:Uncharacterized protein n=1 Tax=Cladophialophora carrionii CBS 160.54 TaxID=1279043 RepID=V9DDM4_9EURO|nr:uncharacterized protein G647_04310 [Cladophialophora carrionii CBS 160.54]ETI24940.1 hypothetical protein G647_04310 [Cladophialophora carrionii CBS 160.54]
MNRDHNASHGEELPSSFEEGSGQQSRFGKTVEQMLAIFLPSHARRNKIDLSTTNPLPWLVNGGALPEPSTVAFRHDTGLRSLLVEYLQNVEPLLREGSDEAIVLAALKSTFHDDALKLLKKVGNDVTAVASWAWVFASQNMDLAFSRYVALAAETRKSGHGRIPKFVPLQLLRAEEVSAPSLKAFIQSILEDLELCSSAKEYLGWNWVTRVCLVVRLLRHARRVAPDSFEDISLIIKHLFADYYTVHPRELERSELQRLCHIFNRFLSLLSFAPLSTPFNAYLFQQNAQLALVRLMFASKPQIPVTREGYRGLIAVQLLHRKTAHERTWAQAKSLSWPPWRQINMGIERDLEYPGKESRVMKLLRRMQEAGYTLGDWERSAAVLAGWDTDGSPTIQTRAILMRQRRPWLLQQGEQVSDRTACTDAPEVWAARIQATRTIREAWASFRSYELAIGTLRPDYRPYFAMLDKLLASTVASTSPLAWKYMPGDIKEAFEVSGNPREVVYVDADVPSVDEFYQAMLRAGIKPGGNLMASLLKQSPSAEAGFAYIRDSGWDEVTKDVLRHAEKYPVSVIRHSLDRLPLHALAAFVSLLCRSGPEDTLVFRAVGYLDANRRELICRDDSDVPAMTYASQLLAAAGITDISVWNALLDGASVGVAKYLNAQGVAFRNAVWRRLKLILWPEKVYISLQADLDTFRLQAKILHQMLRYVNTRIEPKDIGALARTTFVRALYGRTLTFLPSPELALLVVPQVDDLMLMVRVLVSVHDVQGLVALVKWIGEHPGVLGAIPRESNSDCHAAAARGDDGMRYSLRDVLSAVRLFLGGPVNPLVGEEDPARFVSPLPHEPRLIRAAEKHCQKLGWPSDDEVASFFTHNAAWVEIVRRAADSMAQRKAGSRKT